MMDLLHEIKVLVICYHIMLFTPLIHDASLKWKIGYSCCAVLIVGVLVNLIIICQQNGREVKRNCKIKYAKKHAHK